MKMYQSIIPFILVCLGFSITLLAKEMPLFDWELSDVGIASSPNVQVQPYLLTTRLGESISVACGPLGVDSVARFSQNDQWLEQTSQTVFPWLWYLAGLFLFLSGIYIWWVAIWYRYPISEAIAATIIVIVLFGVLLIGVWHGLSSRIGFIVPCPHEYNATLLKVHYEMLVVLLTGIGLELGSAALAFRQIMRAITHRKEPAQSVVG